MISVFQWHFSRCSVTVINDMLDISDISQTRWFLPHLRGDVSEKKRAKLSRDRIASISNISVGISDLLKPHANSGGSELPSCPALEYIRATLYMGIFNLLDSLLHLSIYVSPPPLLCLSLPLGRKCHFIIKTSLLKFHHVSFFFFFFLA